MVFYSVSVTNLHATGMRFGPPGTKKLTHFVDDINMPFVDKYDTQSAIELLRQSIDYHGWCAIETFSFYCKVLQA